MILSKRQRWMIVTSVMGALAAQAAEHMLNSSWRLAALKDPPDDPGYDDVDWRSAILWTVGAGAMVGVSNLLGRQVARAAWKQATGRRPPEPRRRNKIRSRREALG